MKRQDLLQNLHSLFGRDLLQKHGSEWGIRGLESTREVLRVGWATTLLPATVEKAIELDVDFIITHHDAWDWLYEIRDSSLETLKKVTIGHLFVHGLLDQADFGTNGTLLGTIGCEKTEPFCEEGGLNWGRIGELASSRCIDSIENILNVEMSETTRYKYRGKNLCKRIASVTGAGCNTAYVKEAVEKGCDTFITGEYNCYFRMYIETVKLNALVFSHTYTEKKATKALAEKLFGTDENVTLIELPEEHY